MRSTAYAAAVALVALVVIVVATWWPSDPSVSPYLVPHVWP